MFSFFSAFFIALVVAGSLIYLAQKLPSLLDSDTQGVQKMHHIPVPRVGGIAIFLAALLGGYGIAWKDHVNSQWMLLVMLSALPATLGGVLEDFTKNISPRWRMFAMLLTYGAALYLLNLSIPRLNIGILDPWLSVFYGLPGMLLTLFAILTITNAINIIDGYNGLASVVSILILLGIALVAYQVQDPAILSTALVLVGAIMGFLVWNFPHGKIFLGDGGAYCIGSIIGILTIALVQRNQAVSAWFALLLLAYPLFEVAFSIYRRRFIKKQSTSQPDAFHLHQLIFKRIAPSQSKFRNAYTSPFLWLLATLAIVPAVIFYNQTLILAGFFLLFCISYILIYVAIIKWRTPKIIGKISQRQPMKSKT